MKVITVIRDTVYEQYIKGNTEIIEMPFPEHPCRIKKIVNDFIEENKDKDILIYTHNANALDYFPSEYIYLMNPDGSLVPFKKKYKEELTYLYPGEILLNMCPDLVN